MITNKRWMNSDLELYRDTVRRFVVTNVEPFQEQWRAQQNVGRDVWKQAGELGLLLADIPEEYGGSGGNYAHMAILFEELSSVGDRAFGVHVHAIVAHYLLNQGTEEQKRKYLPRLASGEMIAAIAMTEPGAGSDLQGIRTKADRISTANEDQYVINGSKIFISNGFLADLIVVVTKTDTSAGSKGCSLLLVETANQPGFRVGRILNKVGLQGQDTCELFFDSVTVPSGALLGGVEGKGLPQLMSELPYERVMIALSSMVAMERALEMTIEHARQRKAFGQSLMDIQNTRFKLSEVKAQATVARAFMDDCIARMVDGSMDTVTASIAKLWLTEAEGRVIDECLQLFGGYGYMLEYPIARMYADARAQRIYGGTSEIMKEIISRSL